MKIYSLITWDIESGRRLESQALDYDGPVALCKGDSTDEAAMKSSAAFQTRLQNAFKTQFASQQSLLQFLNPKLEAMISNPQGYTPAQMAALNSGAIDTTAGQYQNALKTEQAQAAVHDSGLPSGVDAQIKGQLAGAAASQTSNLLEKNQVDSADLAQQNYWRGVSALSGDAQLTDPLGYSGSANGAASTIASLSEANSQANQSGFLNTFANSFGKGVGTVLSGG